MKKKKGIIISAIIAIIFIAIITVSIIINNGNQSKLITPELKKHFDDIPNDYYGMIDMTNTENVEIKNNEKTNISPKLVKVHTFSQYKISNMKIFTIRDRCFIIFDIENLSYSGDEQQTIELFFYDQNGNGIGSISYELYKNFTIGKKKNIKYVHHLDFSNAYDYKMTTYYE